MEPLLRWIESLDDELLLVTLEIREYWNELKKSVA